MAIELRVQGMSCDHCVGSITSAVTPLPGVSAVDVDLAGGKVTVSGAPDTDVVIDAIEDCGYEVDRAA